MSSLIAGLRPGDIESICIEQGGSLREGVVLTSKGITEQRHSRELQAQQSEYDLRIADPDASVEDKLWARVYLRRAGLRWPEERLLAIMSAEVEADCGADLRLEIAHHEFAVAAFLEEHGLER